MTSDHTPLTPGTTTRGFPVLSFRDRLDAKCVLQASSVADESCIWLGVHWPGSLMHLTKDQVAALLPYLVRFALFGDILAYPDAEFSYRMGLIATPDRTDSTGTVPSTPS